jgi:hypothetical protein
MQVSREDAGGEALMILATDRRADTTTVERIRAIPGIQSVRALDL